MKNYLNVNHFRTSGKDAKRRKKEWKRQRISRGFSDWDWWDLDYFLCNLLAQSLKHYAAHTIGYSDALASSYEEYIKRINNLANMFEEMANWEENHEPDFNDKNWYNENNLQLKSLTKRAFEELAEVFWSLWD